MIQLHHVRSSIGKKVLMALSGAALVVFLISHLAGNLLIFAGPEALNAYALKLRKLSVWLWVARAGLLAAVIIHIVTSVQLAIENRRARPQGYHVYHPGETNWARRTMMLSGVLVLAYLLYHLLHFTFHVAHPALTRFTDDAGHNNVYAMVVMSFRQWPITLAYIAGMACVCLHLSHGVGSTFQTLGLTSERSVPIATWVGRLFALVMFVGYSSIPLAVWCGWVGRDLIAT